MNIITANELKTKGTIALEHALKNKSEAIISVRGKERFVVMPIDQYQHFRECELTAALQDVKEDIKTGRVVRESVAKHIKRIKSA